MKGILSFTLPEEQEEFEQAQNAGKMHAVIDDLFNLIRTKIKYENKTTISLEELREWLSEQV